MFAWLVSILSNDDSDPELELAEQEPEIEVLQQETPVEQEIQVKQEMSMEPQEGDNFSGQNSPWFEQQENEESNIHVR